MTSAIQVLFTVLIISISILFGLMIADDLVHSVDTEGGSVVRDAGLLKDNGVYTTLNDGRGDGQTVYKTTGFAVNTTGADDSFIESDTSINLSSDDNWTVSAWAFVDSGSASNMSALSVNGRVIITFNQTEGNWSAWYYDDGSTNSHEVNVSTSGSETGNFTNIIVWSNSTHLQIYRNNTLGDTKNISTDNISPAPVNSTNWDGRLEEIRTFDRALDSSNRSTVVDTPVEQLPDADPTARIMFDQPNESTQLLLYTDADVTQSNVTFSSGFAEQIMDEGDFSVTGADYKWDVVGPKLAPVGGGELDGAPVAYATYDFGAQGLRDAVIDYGRAMELAANIAILLVVGLIIVRLRGL